MTRRNIPKLILMVLLVLLIANAINAISASNTVPDTLLGQSSTAISANDLKPGECSALNLTAIVVCSGGKCNGTNANDLIMGTAGDDEIKAKNGDDCIVGGGGDDDISGDNDTDVCIGGPGTDIFTKCETEIQ